jgi:MFS superfamily sulfate permease-like transporter
MSDIIIVAVVTGVFSAIGGIISAVASAKVTGLRLQVLEEKVEKHNNFVERVIVLEQNKSALWRNVEEMKKDIEDLERGA